MKVSTGDWLFGLFALALLINLFANGQRPSKDAVLKEKIKSIKSKSIKSDKEKKQITCVAIRRHPGITN